VRGSGGIGKSTTYVVIANDDDGKLHFPDAVMWIQLGCDGSTVTVVNQTAGVVQCTVGHSAADENRRLGEKILVEVKDKAREWIKVKSIPFVADNIFRCDTMLSQGSIWTSIL
jgi:nitrogenase subunit NifH